MALTSGSDIFARLSERAINTILRDASAQRPSLFNYGTGLFVRDPSLLCVKPQLAPGLPLQPIVTRQNLLPIPGTAYGLEYCAQITEVKIDIHPGTIKLPGEIGGLNPQQVAFQTTFCVGIGCPESERLQWFADREAAKIVVASDTTTEGKSAETSIWTDDNEPPLTPVPARAIRCCCLTVFSTWRVSVSNKRLTFSLRDIEIVDIEPDGLEDILECLVKSAIMIGFSSRFRILLDHFALMIGDYQLPLQLANITPNPDVGGNAIAISLNH